MRKFINGSFVPVYMPFIIAFGIFGFSVALKSYAQPTAVPNSVITWFYEDADVALGPIDLFLVCLDGQPTTACARVPVTSGVAGSVAGQKNYTWKLPPLLAGPHTVAVQACTANAAACSAGASLSFTFQVLRDVKGLRLGGG